MKYKCIVCGLVFEPEIGDEEHGISIGTSFEEIPDDWVCPLCGADKSFFKQLD
ncbi:MAG: rubredoxin [Bacteroidota bacterium]